ncbi:hypothetical protein PMZ80_010023 [Knufia obscura]|uniref:Uncharacterized protein n=1 Tax=Knufia obscura TaxID=1635080 RepID=A0ABR0RCH5_9EURO|nr:hypothetical protein PMZ80_010023 [Knufia obscura]
MGIVAALHLWAYSHKPYVLDKHADPQALQALQAPQVSPASEDLTVQEYHGGLLGYRAVLDALNPWDIIKAVGRSIKWLFKGSRQRSDDHTYIQLTASPAKQGMGITDAEIRPTEVQRH